MDARYLKLNSNRIRDIIEMIKKRFIIKNIFTSVLISCVLLFGLYACSSNPSEKYAKNRILRIIDSLEQSHRIKLISVKKTNGKTGTMEGTPVYYMECEITIEFLQDGNWDGIKSSPYFLGSYIQPGSELSAWGYDKNNVKKGQVKTFIDNFYFEKTEKGWR